MYLLGGYYATSSGFIGFDSRMIECWDVAYDVTSQTWSNLSNSSSSHQFRHGHAAAVIGQDIYVIKVYRSGNVDYMHLYNVDTKTLKDDLPSTPTPRNNRGTVAIRVKIAVSANRCFLQIVEAYAYDTFSQKWTTLSI